MTRMTRIIADFWKRGFDMKDGSADLLHKEITDLILNAFYKVYNTLGYGFLEKVYESALAIELRQMGLQIKRQVPIKVYYGQHLVGEYFADLIVEKKVILELKATETIVQANVNQLQNYLKATEIEVGILLNFGRKPEFKRRVFSNSRKALDKVLSV
jgi:GxxExxY protein